MSKNRFKLFAKNADKPAIMDIVILYTLILGIFLAPYAKGLFHSTHLDFEKNINIFLFAGAIFLFYAAYILFIKAKMGLHWIYYGIWLIPISFLISSITPVSKHASAYAVMLYAIYTSLFIIGAYLFEKYEGQLVTAILLSGYAISLFGLLHWFGLSFYRDAVLNNRLSSVFQYANTNAVFLLVLLMGSLYLMAHAGNRPKFSSLAMSFAAVPLAFSFLATESRGALIALPVLFLVILWLMPFLRQIVFLVYFAVAFAAALAVYPALKSIGVSLQKHFDLGQSLLGWFILIIASLAYAGFFIIFHKFVLPPLQNKLDRMKDRMLVRSVVPLLIFAIGGLFVAIIVLYKDQLSFLPSYLQRQISRISLQENSILERFAFFRDAFKMFLDHPVFGAGGGAWAEAYQSYQSNPYVSQETHNFYAQYLLETGIFGSLIFIAIVGYVLLHFARRASATRQKMYAMVMAILVLGILIHSLVDFNMSFAYIASLVFLALGGLSSACPKNPARVSTWIKKTRLDKIMPVCLVLASLLLAVQSARFIQSNHLYFEVQQKLTSNSTVNFRDVHEQLSRASKLHPTQPIYKLFHASILMMVYEQTADPDLLQQALDLTGQLLRQEPYNASNFIQYVNILAHEQKHHEVFQASIDGMKKFPWITFFYEQALTAANQIFDSGDLSEARNIRSQVEWILERIVRQQEIQAAVPEGQKKGTPFIVSQELIDLTKSKIDSL